MKRLWKMLAAALTCCLLCCLGAGAVHAETYTGEIRGGYQWELNTSTGLLTIRGGRSTLIYQPDQDPVWTPYAGSVRAIWYDSTELSYLPKEALDDLPNLERYYGQVGEISWNIDPKTSTQYISGKGELDRMELWKALHAGTYAQIQRVEYQDGITQVPGDISNEEFDIIYLGKDVIWDEELAFIARKAWEVSPDNKTLAAWNGALYTKDYKTLLALPTENIEVERHPNTREEAAYLTSGTHNSYYWKLDRQTKTLTIGPKPLGSTYQRGWPINEGECDPDIRYVVVQDGVTNPGLRCRVESSVETVTLGKDVQTVDSYAPLPNTAYIVDEDNPWLTTYDGALYSKDLTQLISVPRKKQAIQFPDTLTAIGDYAFARTSMPLVALPETVTTVGNNIFSEVTAPEADDTEPAYPRRYPPATVAIFPDTITSIQGQTGRGSYQQVLYFFSASNKLVTEAIGNYNSSSREYEAYVAFGWQRAGAANVTEFYERQRAGLGPRKLFGMTYIDERRWAYYTEQGDPMWGGEVTLPDGQLVYFYDNTTPMNYFDANDPTMHWYKKGNNWLYGTETRNPIFSQWIKTGNTWYYVDRTGARCTNGWIYGRDNKWYYVGPDGAMYASRWVWYNNHWFYLNDSGAMAVNTWIYGKDHKWYYVNQDGVMSTNRWIYGKDHYWYYVGKDGAMLTNTWTPDGYYVNGNEVWVS